MEFFVIRRIEVGQNYKGKKHPHLSYGQKEIYKDIVIDEPYWFRNNLNIFILDK